MTTCLFSISYAGLWGQDALPLDSFIAHAGKLGFQAVMIAGKRPHLSPLDITDEVVAKVTAALRSAGVSLAVIAGYTDFSVPGAAEVPLLEMQISYVEQLSRLAQRLGATVVRVFTGYEHAGQAPGETWRRVTVGLRECCDRAAAHGVTIAVQNHHDVGVHSSAMLELLGDVGRENCKLGFDAWSPTLIGEDVEQTARKMAPHVAITTNADYVVLPRFSYQPQLVNYRSVSPGLVRAVPFGEGTIDYAAFFRGLTAGGFDGIATYEMCSPLRGGGSMANLDACAGAYLRWMAHALKGGYR